MTQNESLLPLLFTSTDETEINIDSLEILGDLPRWLNGTLVRTGPARFSVGNYEYRHWFDGLAMLHSFSFGGGKVSYRSSQLDSQSWKLAKEAQRNVLTEFATYSSPDPCQSLFRRFFSYFSTAHNSTDNCNVSVIPLPSAKNPAVLAAMTETPYSIGVELKMLNTLGPVRFASDQSYQTQTAHVHTDDDGNLWNVAVYFGYKNHYSVFKTHREVLEESLKSDMNTLLSKNLEKGGKSEGGLEVEAEEKARIGMNQASYMHSFGASKNYIIIAEWPLIGYTSSFALASITRRPFMDHWQWKPELGTKITVVSKEDGSVCGIFKAPPVYSFHHVNAYEEEGNLVMDISAYDDNEVIKSFLLENVRDPNAVFPRSRFERYVLRLSEWQENEEIEVNPSRIDVPFAFELPRINSDFVGKKYRFAYSSSAMKEGEWGTRIIKLDLETEEVKNWDQEGLFPSEPVFVPKPGSKEEDDGVVLSLVMNPSKHSTFLLILDGKSFKEIARAESPAFVPFPLHGTFVYDK